MIENQINQTLITDSDVTEMARSMGLEVNIGPTTDGTTSTSNLSSISGTEELENILVENSPVLEEPSRDRVEAAEITLNQHI